MHANSESVSNEINERDLQKKAFWTKNLNMTRI
jgi:hypothetical protein